MRRIIERIVTVVTTTTWKISWEADPPSPPIDVMEEISQDTPPRPTSVEAKEVDTSVRKDHNEPNDG